MAEYLEYARHPGNHNYMTTLVLECGDAIQSDWQYTIDEAQAVVRARVNQGLEANNANTAQGLVRNEALPSHIVIRSMTEGMEIVARAFANDQLGVLNMERAIINSFKVGSRDFCDLVLKHTDKLQLVSLPGTPEIMKHNFITNKMRVLKDWSQEHLGMHPGDYTQVVFVERLAIPMIHFYCPFNYTIYIAPNGPRKFAEWLEDWLRNTHDYDVQICTFDQGSDKSNWASCNLILLECQGNELETYLNHIGNKLGWTTDVANEKLALMPIFLQHNLTDCLMTNKISETFREDHAVSDLSWNSGLEFHSIGFGRETEEQFKARVQDFLLSNPLPCYESFQNKFHARCATCKRRLKEKTEMIGIMNGDNIVDFKWNIRLQCICPENPSVICVRENSGVYYDRNALHVGFKLIWHMREGLGPFVLPAYQPPLRLFFSSVNDNINPLLASLAPLASANPLFALLQAKK